MAVETGSFCVRDLEMAARHWPGPPELALKDPETKGLSARLFREYHPIVKRTFAARFSGA
jgi:hypothetical protein